MLPIRTVVFPGRHHIVTRFQVDYLRALRAGLVRDTAGQPIVCDPDVVVAWVVTSANHAGTRRNPLPGHRREGLIEAVVARESLRSVVIPVPDTAPNPAFAHQVVTSIETTMARAGAGAMRPNPVDTIVACSTPEVAAMYQELGFRIAAVEADVLAWQETAPEPAPTAPVPDDGTRPPLAGVGEPAVWGLEPGVPDTAPPAPALPPVAGWRPSAAMGVAAPVRLGGAAAHPWEVEDPRQEAAASGMDGQVPAGQGASMPARPWDVVELMARADRRWRALAHPAAVDFYTRYGLDTQVSAIFADPVVGGDGDLTATRDYRTYAAAFEDASARKWAQIEPWVRPGRIVDIGCASGGLLECAAREPRLHESDLFGVDVARPLIAEAEHKKAQGAFANPNVWFVQANILSGRVMPARSVDTTVTVALTHEVSSYGSGVAEVERFARRVYEHTRPGGVWINSDVCGPGDPDRLVELRFVPDAGAEVAGAQPGARGAGGATHDARDGVGDGRDGVGARRAGSGAADGGAMAGEETPMGARADLDALPRAEVAAYVESLSAERRLVQFAYDFPRLSRARFSARRVGPGRWRMTLRDAMEFMATKDYVDNWLSECHERFCDLNGPGWAELLAGAGFEVEPVGGAWRNDWLVEQRFAPVATLHDAASGAELPWPDTHILTVARRPEL